MVLEKEYKVEGMTCMGCVNNVTNKLLSRKEVETAEVSFEEKSAKITFSQPLAVEELQETIGKYTISEWQPSTTRSRNNVGEEISETESALQNAADSLPEAKLTTYKPLFLIVAFIAGASLLVQYPFGIFSGMLWMRHFMAGFFLVFSFFKLLNLSGFADSYRMYDIVAGNWKGWGYLYPFVELALGVAYLIDFQPFYTNLVTVIVLGISTIGVVKSNLDKRKIKCACLGDVFNLPMSTVTIVEDVSMVLMAGWMLLK